MVQHLNKPSQIDPDLWAKSRTGARAGRGFRFQDAVCAWLAVEAWAGTANWEMVLPEGLDDASLHGPLFDIQVQIKSRHDPRGIFSLDEIATYLAKMNLPVLGKSSNNSRFALVLERPVRGLEAPGWSKEVSKSGQGLNALEDAVRKACAPRLVDFPALFDRLYIVVTSDPLAHVPTILDQYQSRLLPAAGRLVGQMLREAAGRAADDNYARSASDPASLGATSVQVLIDQVQRIVDPAGQLMLADDLCDAVNFHEALDPNDFYKGINVMPGHVGAGLVFERPKETNELLESLASSRMALIAGPSGAGKSALMWLAAYYTRHSVRWYRVRRLGQQDVSSLLQFARLHDANQVRPIGFVVDDVGRAGTAGWDSLVSEAKAISGICILGSIREEDLFLLANDNARPTVRPRLDEGLAERVWAALSTEGSVAFQHWVEPFEQSRGLLLEYMHLLSEGENLEKTLSNQVRQRLQEGRDDELEVLSRIVFPSRYGGSVDGRVLRERLNWTGPRMSRALARLVEEHAVRESADGVLEGLHEMRSAYLDDALRASIDEPTGNFITDAAWTVSKAALPGFIVRLLRAYPNEHTALLEALAERIMKGDIAALEPALHGLGLVSADMIAAQWLEITRRLDIDDRHSSLLFTLAAAGPMDGDGPIITKLREAIAAFSEVAVVDLRTKLLGQITDISSLVNQKIDYDAYHRLQASLVPLRGCKTPPNINFSLHFDISTTPLIQVLELLRTASVVASNDADRILSVAGGSKALLERLPDELAWITRPKLLEVELECGGKELVVEGFVRVVSGDLQTNLHADVVRLCELMLAAAPEATRAVSDTILPNGQSLVFNGHSCNRKQIARENLPAPAKIAWSRAQGRAIDRLVSATQDTQRTASIAMLISELNQKLDEAANLYLRMEKPKERWRLIVNLGATILNFVPPPRVSEAMSNPLDAGSYTMHDWMHSFVADLQKLVLELADNDGVNLKQRAARVISLLSTARKLEDPSIWRVISSPPTRSIIELVQRLEHIRIVYGFVDRKPDQLKKWAIQFARTSRHHSALPKATAYAITQSERLLEETKNEYEEIFAKACLSVKIVARTLKEDKGYSWPNVAYVALVQTASIRDWLSGLETFSEVSKSLVGSPRISCAPLILNHVVPISVVQIGEALLPDLNFVEEWSSELPWPIIDPPLLDRVTRTLNDVTTLSTMIQDKGSNLNAQEILHFEAYLDRVNNAVARFAQAFEANPTVENALASSVVLTCVTRLARELERPLVEEPLAVEFGRMLTNEFTELTQEVFGMRTALLEHALELEEWAHLSEVLELNL